MNLLADVLHTFYHTLQPVGGSDIPVDKLALLAPYLGSASAITIIAATIAAAAILYVKRIKHRKVKE